MDKTKLKQALLWWGITFLMLIYFDVLWCFDTTFTSMSMPLTYINALLLSLLLSLPAILWNAGKVQLVILALLGIWLECNLMYCRTYFSHIPLSSYGLAGNLSDFGASVLDSLRWCDLGFLAIFIAGFFEYSRLPRMPKNHKKPVMPYLLCLAILICLSALCFALNGGYMAYWRSLTNANYHSTRALQYTIPGALIHDFIDGTPTLTPERKQAVEKWRQSQKPLEAISENQKDNIVLVLCESLESWPIGLTLEGKEITPNLNRLIADTATLYAPKVLTQVGAGRSIDAQLLYNAGMLPMEGEVYSFACPNSDYHTLNQALAELRGARSYILTPDKPIVWNQEAIAHSFGIDTIVSRSSWRKEELMGGRNKVGDRSLMRQITQKMASGEVWPGGENAFVQIVTYSGHSPFIIPDELNTLNLQGDYPKILKDYVSCAHYTDEALGILIDYLQSRPDWNRTLLVITGDHEGLAAYRSGLADSHSWVSPRPFTPLIVANSPQALHYGGVMGQVDVYPTLLQLMGLTDYPWHGIGQSILSPNYVSPDNDSLMPVRQRASDTLIRFPGQ